jgi:hypothetical protein
MSLIFSTLRSASAALLFSVAAASSAWSFESVCGFASMASAISPAQRPVCLGYDFRTSASRSTPKTGEGDDAAAATAPTQAISATFKVPNFYSQPDAREPTLGGKMKKTVWGRFFSPTSKRVVVQTFQSDVDTILAVYSGPDPLHLTKRFENDNTVVSGFGGQQSLVQFTAQAGTEYFFQIGSKTGTTGNIYASVSAFPTAGGLSSYLAKIGATAWQGRDFICGYGDPALSACANPLFILHNSTAQPLTVRASSTLGTGVVPPADFTSPAGGVKTAQFTFSPSFNTTTPRTVSGAFTFTGLHGSTAVTRAETRGLIVVGNPVLGNKLVADVTPTVRAGWTNEFLPFSVTLTNTSTQAATGCHARTGSSERLKTVWRQINPSSGAFIAAPNRPIGIPAGQSRSIQVSVASQEARLADPQIPIRVVLDCNNTEPAPLNLSNTFDLTAYGDYRPAQVRVAKLAPSADTLLVPAAGGVFRVSVVNRSATTELRALAIYAEPFGECCVPAKQFKITICRLASANGACLAPTSPNSIEYIATNDVAKYFKITVKPPATNPGFDPTKRRVFFKVWQDAPPSGTFDAVVAAESVAVKKQ